MLRRLSIAAASILSVLFIASPNANAAQAPRITSPLVDAPTDDLCENLSAFCMRDPSNGGAGTTVVASFKSDSEAEDWKIILDTGRCLNAMVTPKCPGGWISANMVGAVIVVLKNVGQGTLCIRTAADTSYVAKMGACDTGPPPNGNGEISSAFIIGSADGGDVFDSVDASNVFSQQEWLTGGTTNDSTVFDKPGNLTGNGEWIPFSS